MKFILLLILASLPLAAEDMVFDKETGHIVPKYMAELKSFKGKVFKKKPSGRLSVVTPGTRFFKDETLVVEDKSIAKLLVVDDTTLTVGPQSEFNFTDFKFVTKSNRRMLYTLIKGQLRGEVKNKAEEDNVIFKTRNATLGVRGTKILVNHRTLNNNLEVSEFALESGSADVKNFLNKEKVELKKDDRVVIVKDAGSGEAAHEGSKLSADELGLLKDEDQLLPYYMLEMVQPSSKLFTLLNKPASANTEKSGDLENVERKVPEQKGSFHNLDKLNEKLKENQKRR